jgi:hypothetical protein
MLHDEIQKRLKNMAKNEAHGLMTRTLAIHVIGAGSIPHQGQIFILAKHKKLL